MEILILPHQLFDIKYYPKTVTRAVLWEHPQYFTKYKYNKKRLIMHRASMKYYENYLKGKKIKVKYYNFNQKVTGLKKYVYFDPVDKIKMPKGGEKMETPNFILNHNIYEEYQKKTQSYIFGNFYMWSKKRIDLLPNLKSQDKLNRKKLPKNVKIPKLPSNTSDQKWIKEATTYVEKHFKKNYGNTDSKFLYPVTHTSARRWLRDFLSKRIKNFGAYQDAISKDQKFQFHSILSTSINIGLLNPNEIIQLLLKQKSKIPKNSFEGYLRQLFWREYQRYCYIYVKFNSLNYFGNKKRLTKSWYTGKLGVPPVDDAIIDGFDTGYLHHIQRLMVVGNYMNLSGISPKEGFKWFMEFSCDSYEWVMYQNVYDMVFFVTGGKTMRRPYVSSSNYILKMSDYKRGDWSDEWDDMYRDFIDDNRKKLWKFRYYFRGLKK